jgi:hypothetical protein
MNFVVLKSFIPIFDMVGIYFSEFLAIPKKNKNKLMHNEARHLWTIDQSINDLFALASLPSDSHELKCAKKKLDTNADIVCLLCLSQTLNVSKLIVVASIF